MSSERTAPFAGRSNTVMFLGDMITILLTGEDTSGKYSVVEITTPPGGGPSFLHTHLPAESFYVVKGKYEIYGQDADGRKFVTPVSVGETIQVPAGAPHGFGNVGSSDGTVMAIFEPAGNMELLFEEVGTPVEDKSNPEWPEGPPDLDGLMPTLEKYKVHIIEAPPK